MRFRGADGYNPFDKFNGPGLSSPYAGMVNETAAKNDAKAQKTRAADERKFAKATEKAAQPGLTDFLRSPQSIEARHNAKMENVMDKYKEKFGPQAGKTMKKLASPVLNNIAKNAREMSLSGRKHAQAKAAFDGVSSALMKDKKPQQP